MKLSSRARYAMQLMLEMAGSFPSKALSLGDVSKKTNISRRYLDQLAHGLKKAELIRGQSGRGGGYALTRHPRQITLGEIVEAAIGPINIVDCVRHPGICLKADYCQCRDVYAVVNNRVRDVFQEISLEQLADQENWMLKTEKTPFQGCPTH